MTEFLKQSSDRLLILFGLLLTLLSLFKIEDIKKLDFQPRPASSLVLLIGLLFVVAGIAFHFLEQETFTFSKIAGAHKEGNGYAICIGEAPRKATVAVTFGRLEDVSQQHTDAIVVLPANEFFDDECMEDPKSSLGAFILKHYPAKLHDLKSIIAEKLQGVPTTQVEKEKKLIVASYAVGTCVSVDRALGTGWRLLFAAVTTKRAGWPLKAESQDVIKVVQEIGGKLADLRASDVVLPVMGSGHGGLSPEAALTCILIGFVELLTGPGGRQLRRIDIVVFQEDQKTPPELSKRQVLRALTLARSCCNKTRGV
jgi:hypothetical protein